MKYLLIHHTGLLGGGTLSFIDIINILSEKKVDFSVVLPPGKSAARELISSLGVEITDYSISPITFGYYNGSSPLYKAVVKYFLQKKHKDTWIKIFEKEKPDVVIINSIVQWPMISLLKSLNIKTLCFVRETMKGRSSSIINRIISYNIQKADGVAFLSHYDKDEWQLNTNNVQKVIPDLVDIEKFKKNFSKEEARITLKLEVDNFYILYVGGMNKLKGADVILKALSLCKGKKIKLLFLGDLGEKVANNHIFGKIKDKRRINFINEMHLFIKENKLEEKVKLVGIQKEMNYWYAASDVVVFPVEKAHQGRPIYEAGVFGKPAIVSHFSNFNEYLYNNENGLFFEPNNHVELARHITKLYENEDLLNELGKENYSMTIKYHDAKKIKKKIELFLGI